MVEEIDPTQFDEHVTDESQPVVVDFYTQSCGPCKTYKPTFESVAEQYEDVKFVQVNIEEEPNLAMKYGIRSVPTTASFKDGTIVESRSGVLNDDSLSTLVQTVRE